MYWTSLLASPLTKTRTGTGPGWPPFGAAEVVSRSSELLTKVGMKKSVPQVTVVWPLTKLAPWMSTIAPPVGRAGVR